MKRENLERYLERGDGFGFIKETDDANYLGWILLRKRQPNNRYLSLLAPGEDPHFVEEQEQIRQKPYQLNVIELSVEAYESDKYETDDDYRVNDLYRFASLDEVEIFLQRFGHTLVDIKWETNLNAP